MRDKKGIIGNQGSSLLIVLLAVSFITILATMGLSMSALNLQMKSIENKSKRNFYSAEVALDELKAGLETELASIVERVYTDTMITYSEVTVGERTKAFKENFLKEYIKKYSTEEINTIRRVPYDTAHLNTLLDKTKDKATVSAGKEGVLVWELENRNIDRQYVKFTNVIIEYISEENFTSRIKTDIKVAVPNLSMESIGVLPSFTEYALIADVKMEATKGNVNIYGDVFAGTEGILAQGNKNRLSILGNKVVTKDTILAKDGASIMLNDNDEDEDKHSLDIWAKNIETNSTSANTAYSSTIQASGNLYIADDTTLNAVNSTIKYNGSYYGYGYQEKPEESSAIMINRQNCLVDLTELSNLFVAGRAYIEPPMPNSASTTSKPSADKYVQTGESISIKGGQVAYRLPTECIGATTNPMSLDEYKKLPTVNGKIKVDMGYEFPFSNKKLSDYVDSSEPFRAIFHTSGTSTYVYLYLNFKNARMANEYTQAYCKNSDSPQMNGLKERMKQYGSSILLPNNMGTKDGRKTFAGNLIGYQKDGEFFKLYENSVDAVLPQQFVTESDELTKMYQAYCKKLLPSISEEEDKYTTMFDALIIDESKDLEHPGFKELLAGKEEVTIIDTEYGNSYLVENAGKEAFKVDDRLSKDVHLIIATGDVEVKRDFTGLIISKGKITFGAGVSVTADTAILYDLISHTNVKYVFRDYNSFGNYLTTEDGVQLEFSGLIKYENWKKD